MPVLTLLTDFGLTDYYVAAVKGTVLRLAPATVLVDISHDVPAGDVETASFLLAAAFPSFPAGTVHLAVVDPGVGSERRILAARTARDFLLAPDNGLLTSLLDRVEEIRSVERADLFLPGPGQTFHGRDRFAPAAAWLLRGESFATLGPVVHDPVRLPVEPPQREEGRLIGRVAHVDRYGNLVTDIPAAWLPTGSCRVEVGSRATERHASCYAEILPGEAAFLSGSLGTIELSLNRDNLAREWGVARGTVVRITW
ncbi:MAG TPA: SAM-dependent chlorinase/fluorinase [Thermoanaerobaculia bacterium]|nr:SAM-dependent chlorinase/fluorinase [Thermoanaerobaculia bacterium]